VALAWGARFSESHILVADREEMVARDQKGVSRCRVVQLLVIRAREVGEVWKAFRSAKMDNVFLGILMEPLLARKSDAGLKGILLIGRSPLSERQCVHTDDIRDVAYTRVSIDMCGLCHASPVDTWFRLLPWVDGDHGRKEETRSSVSLVDNQPLGRVYVSVPSSTASVVRPVYIRIRGSADRRHDADFDIEHPPPTPSSQYSEAWHAASLAGSALSAKLSAQVFTRKVKGNGIPLSYLVETANSLSRWRDEHLSKLGVPSKWPEDWDFLAAITACSTDVYYHCLWLVVMRAVDDFGIIGTENLEEAKAIKERYKTESDHGAMRIAALVSHLVFFRSELMNRRQY
jgi:hypothetical protein